MATNPRPTRRVSVQLADGQNHTLVYDFNALIALEEATGRSFLQAGEWLGASFGLKDIRALLWAGLLDENEQLTLKQAGQLIDVGTTNTIFASIMAAVNGAQPDAESGQTPATTSTEGTGAVAPLAG